MHELAWHPDAEEELNESGDYYEFRQPGLGIRMGHAVLAAIGEAAINPERYRAVAHGCRAIRVKRFPFRVIYRFTGAAIQIIAIMHDSRRPGCWIDRTRD